MRFLAFAMSINSLQSQISHRAELIFFHDVNFKIREKGPNILILLLLKIGNDF